MVNAMEAARETARQALEKTYDGVMTVTEHRKVRNTESKLTEYEDVITLEAKPCRLSFSNIHTVVQTETAAKQTQTVKLFLSPDITIKPGSKITVTQSGVTEDYTRSGKPAVYETHQEVMLDLWKEWA